jgi:DNA polymerase I-like protein with 3'-5' exonuclease and polymerase domains
LRAWCDDVLTNAPRFEFYGHILPVVALDTEDSSLDTRLFIRLLKQPDGSYKQVYELKTDITGICLSADGVKGIYIPINHEFQDLELKTPAKNMDRRACAEILQWFFDQVHLVFYNGKFDREIMRLTMGIVFRPYPFFEDVQVLQYINDPKADMEDKKFYTGDSGGLKALSKNVLNIEQIELGDIAKVKAETCPYSGSPFCKCSLEKRKESKHGLKNHFSPFPWIPVDLALWYAASDAICTWLLWERLHELARSRRTVHRIDHELVDSIAWIERQRFIIDTDRHRRTVKGHQKKIALLEGKLYDLAIAAGYQEPKTDEGKVLEEDRFNPGSTKQLQELFFNVKKFKVTKKTPGGAASCDAEVIEDLRKAHPEDKFLATLLDYRDYQALHPASLSYDPSDGTARIYLKQNVVAGGRLSSAGGDFYKDGGFGLNSQAVKKVEGYLMWKVQGNILSPDEIPEDQIEEHTEEELHSSCFKEVEEDVVVGYKDDVTYFTEEPDGGWSDDSPQEIVTKIPILEKQKVRKKAPGIIKNHIGQYMGYAVCLVPGCKTCHDKFGVLIENGKIDANEVVNLRCLFHSPPGYTFATIDYCLSPETRLLTSGLQWKESGSIVEGEELIGFDEQLPVKRWGRRRLHPSLVEKVQRRKLPCVKVVTDKGSVVCYEGHEWLTRVRKYGDKRHRGQYDWVPASKLKIGQQIAYLCDPWDEDISYEAGYLRGVFDGEGWVSRQALGFGQKEGCVLDTTERLLKEKNFNFVRDSNGKTRVSVLRSNGGRNEVFRFIGSIRPERLLNNVRSKMWEGLDYQSKTCQPVKILSIEPVGVQEVIAIRTSTHTFIAEGLLSHNCNIEMRAAANVSGEPEFINEFLHGKGDFHSLTASKVFPEFNDPNHKNYHAKHLRDLAKVINFALLYGGTAYTIYENMKKQDPNITFQDCERMVADYWRGVPTFFQWCQRKQVIAKEQLICTTTTGRVINFQSAMTALHIHVPGEEERKNTWKYRDLMKKVKETRAKKDPIFSEYASLAQSMWKNLDTGVRNCIDYDKFMGKIQRVAGNIPIQGLSGDFMRMTLNKIHQWVEKDPAVATVFLLHCSVHDEVDFSVKDEYMPFVMPRVTRIMKLRKLHEWMQWPVPIEADAEYGPSWDVEHYVTGDDDHPPAAWTKIKAIASYIPDYWDSLTIKNLILAIASEDEKKVAKADAYLKEALHSRAYQAAWHCFHKKEGKKEVVPQTDRKEIQRALIAAVQLDEYWRLDGVPDEGTDTMETLAQYEERMGLGPENRNPIALMFGPLGSIPLDAEVIRFSSEPLDSPAYIQHETLQMPPEVSEPGGGTQGISELPVAVENNPADRIDPISGPPPTGVTIFDLGDMGNGRDVQLSITLGKGHNHIWVRYEGLVFCIKRVAMDHIPDKFLKKV